MPQPHRSSTTALSCCGCSMQHRSDTPSPDTENSDGKKGSLLREEKPEKGWQLPPVGLAAETTRCRSRKPRGSSLPRRRRRGPYSRGRNGHTVHIRPLYRIVVGFDEPSNPDEATEANGHIGRGMSDTQTPAVDMHQTDRRSIVHSRSVAPAASTPPPRTPRRSEQPRRASPPAPEWWRWVIKRKKEREETGLCRWPLGRRARARQRRTEGRGWQQRAICLNVRNKQMA